jgi:hypothetical protein
MKPYREFAVVLTPPVILAVLVPALLVGSVTRSAAQVAINTYAQSPEYSFWLSQYKGTMTLLEQTSKIYQTYQWSPQLAQPLAGGAFVAGQAFKNALSVANIAYAGNNLYQNPNVTTGVKFAGEIVFGVAATGLAGTVGPEVAVGAAIGKMLNAGIDYGLNNIAKDIDSMNVVTVSTAQQHQDAQFWLQQNQLRRQLAAQEQSPQSTTPSPAATPIPDSTKLVLPGDSFKSEPPPASNGPQTPSPIRPDNAQPIEGGGIQNPSANPTPSRVFDVWSNGSLSALNPAGGAGGGLMVFRNDIWGRNGGGSNAALNTLINMANADLNAAQACMRNANACSLPFGGQAIQNQVNKVMQGANAVPGTSPNVKASAQGTNANVQTATQGANANIKAAAAPGTSPNVKASAPGTNANVQTATQGANANIKAAAAPGTSPNVKASAPGTNANVQTATPGANANVQTAVPGTSPNVQASAQGTNANVQTATPGANANVQTAVPGTSPNVQASAQGANANVVQTATPGANANIKAAAASGVSATIEAASVSANTINSPSLQGNGTFQYAGTPGQAAAQAGSATQFGPASSSTEAAAVRPGSSSATQQFAALAPTTRIRPIIEPIVGVTPLPQPTTGFVNQPTPGREPGAPLNPAPGLHPPGRVGTLPISPEPIESGIHRPGGGSGPPPHRGPIIGTPMPGRPNPPPVHTPIVTPHVPQVQVRVPEVQVHVPQVQVRVPQVQVRIPSR